MEKILQVQDLTLSFQTDAGVLQAIRGVSFDLYKGETLAIVGESGSGKSVTSKVIMGMMAKNATIHHGAVLFDGKDIVQLSQDEMVQIRGKRIAMIFQDPMTSLNPTMTIGKQIMESVQKHTGANRAEAKARAMELLADVGISNPAKRMKQYPHQFSGGMRQRVVIAIALAGEPDVLIADEPTTALDVTIQSQILELIQDIQKKRNISIIFITHDLGVVANIADRVAVMYAGKIVEYGQVEEIYYTPKHPYTWGLLGSLPDMSEGDALAYIKGATPNLVNPPKGDAFSLRSDYTLRIDFEQAPPFFQITETHYVASWLYHPDAPKVEMPQGLKRRIDQMLSEVY